MLLVQLYLAKSGTFLTPNQKTLGSIPVRISRVQLEFLEIFGDLWVTWSRSHLSVLYTDNVQILNNLKSLIVSAVHSFLYFKDISVCWPKVFSLKPWLLTRMISWSLMLIFLPSRDDIWSSAWFVFMIQTDFLVIHNELLSIALHQPEYTENIYFRKKTLLKMFMVGILIY